MGFKEILKQKLSDEEIMLKQKFKSARSIFIFSVCIFFLNFFFVGGGFYYDIFIQTISFTYLMLLLSFFHYLYFLVKINFYEKIKERKYMYYILIGFFVLLCIALLLPVLFEAGNFPI